MMDGDEALDAMVETGCRAIYEQFDGYWPSGSERARIRTAIFAAVSLPDPVMVSCGTEDCDFCPCPVLPENADKGWPCARTGKPMVRVA